MYIRSVSKSIIFFLTICFFTSCVDTRKTTYFNDLNDTVLKSSNYDLAEHIIQRNDILSIRVTSLNNDASLVFNSTNTQGASIVTATGSRSESSGYMVSADGNIELPMLGVIKADGLTKTQLKEKITKIILDKKLLVEPIVDIRQLNYEVTILGEVAKPTVITVPNEKISLIKALGVAGDITIFGRKDNVLLIREDDGKKIIKRLDLNSSNFLQSEYYYLKPNDVVYVEANKNKEANVSRSRIWIPTIISAISLIVLLQYRYFR